MEIPDLCAMGMEKRSKITLRAGRIVIYIQGMSATVKITKEVEVFLTPASKVDVLRQIDITV